MKTIKVSEATNQQLDWLVAKCEGAYKGWPIKDWLEQRKFDSSWRYTTDPAQMWPIIDREKISVVCAEGDYNPEKSGTPDCYDTYWVAVKGRQTAQNTYARFTALGPLMDDWGTHFQIEADACSGPTQLIAAARCYVESRLGETVEVPEEL